MKEVIFSIVLLVAFIAAFITFAAGVGYWSGSNRCINKWQGYEPEYPYWGSYKIRYNGKIIPADSVREIQ